MGCDIHLYTEVKKGRRWISADDWYEEKYDDDETRTYAHHVYDDRNYGLFGMLAGVRYTPCPPFFEARGVPNNMSKKVHREVGQWGVDGHTHSWYTLEELELTLLKPKSKAAELLIREILKKRHNIATDTELAVQISLGTVSRDDLDLVLEIAQAWKSDKESKGIGWESFVNQVTSALYDRMKKYKATDARIVFWFDN